MGTGPEDARYRIGDIAEAARVAIGENITWIEAAQAPRALRQLPPDITDFTDREAQLAELRAQAQPAIEGRGSRVLALAGAPGVGKSALALHLAHQLVEQFPDVQLYANLRTPAGQALMTDDVLAGFLRALGVSDEAIPQTAEERASLYRSQLAHKRALVLLDNATQEAQVRQLLPAGPGCLALVTSRRHLTALAEASHSQRIAVLEPEAAVQLLGRVAGIERVAAEPQAAKQLAQLCGHLPLALRITGARLRSRERWSINRLLHRLSDQNKRLKELEVGDLEVRTAFALSYEELSDQQARLFRLVSLLGGPDFGIHVAAALIQSTAEEAEDLLGQIHDAQLLEAASEDRYRFHDLLRLFAAERLEADEERDRRHAALQRALNWYLEQASAADAALDPRLGLGPYVEAALTWFEIERLALIAAIERSHDAGLWEPGLRLSDKLSRFFSVRAYWANWERTLTLALAAIQRSGDRHNEGKALNNLGVVYDKQGRWDEAIACYEQTLAVDRELGDRHGEGKSLNNLGVVYDRQGRREQAIACYEQSLATYREFGDRHGEAQTFNNLGHVYDSQERSEQAIACYEQSLAIKRELDDRHGEGMSLNNLGMVYDKQGRWDEAIACYEQSLAIKREFGDRHGEGMSLNNLGVVYDRQGRREEAIACYEQSLTLKRKLDDRYGEAQTLNNLGLVYDKQGRWDEAIACYEQSLAVSRELGDRRGEGNALINQGLLLHRRGDQERARIFWREALVILEALDAPEAATIRILAAS